MASCKLGSLVVRLHITETLNQNKILGIIVEVAETLGSLLKVIYQTKNKSKEFIQSTEFSQIM